MKENQINRRKKLMNQKKVKIGEKIIHKSKNVSEKKNEMKGKPMEF